MLSPPAMAVGLPARSEETRERKAPSTTPPTLMGGLFGLEDLPGVPGESDLPFLHDEHLLLANARSGISLLLQVLSPPRVWVPSYLCAAVLQPIWPSGASLNFYEVDYDLNLRSRDWLDEVKKGDMILVVDYFGVPFELSPMKQAKRRGAWILEDASQALLSDLDERESDFILYSPRKYVGVPDGGILIHRGKIEPNGIDLPPPLSRGGRWPSRRPS